MPDSQGLSLSHAGKAGSLLYPAPAPIFWELFCFWVIGERFAQSPKVEAGKEPTRTGNVLFKHACTEVALDLLFASCALQLGKAGVEWAGDLFPWGN